MLTDMKYGINGSGLAAASILFALAFVSCRMERFQEELVPGDGAAKVEVLFSTGQPETRTSFTDKTGDEYPVIWTENDEAISVSMNYDEASLAPVTPSKDGKSASFKAIFPYSSGNCRFLAVSPYTASGGPSPSRRKTGGDGFHHPDACVHDLWMAVRCPCRGQRPFGKIRQGQQSGEVFGARSHLFLRGYDR